MKTYNISTPAGYARCGEAFATIQNNVVMALSYVGGLLTCNDYDDLDNGIVSAKGKAKIADFAEANPTMKIGMCSCWKFCV